MPTTEERLEALERIAGALEAEGKAFMMILVAVFATMEENPEVIKRAIASLYVSTKAAEQENAHVVVLSRLNQASMLLDGLLHQKN